MMSFNLYIQQNQWVIITLLAGTGLAIIFVLTYWAMWRPREMEKKGEEPVSVFRWVLTFMPWVVIVLIMICAVFTIAWLQMAAKNPPNW